MSTLILILGFLSWFLPQQFSGHSTLISLLRLWKVHWVKWSHTSYMTSSEMQELTCLRHARHLFDESWPDRVPNPYEALLTVTEQGLCLPPPCNFFENTFKCFPQFSMWFPFMPPEENKAPTLVHALHSKASGTLSKGVKTDLQVWGCGKNHLTKWVSLYGMNHWL